MGIVFASACVSQKAPEEQEIQQLPPPPQQPLLQIPLQQNQMPGNPLLRDNTYLTFSDDGKNWKQGALIRKSASVPDLIQLTKDIGKFKKGDLLIYFVDALTIVGPGTEQLGIISSSDSGKTWVEQGTIKLAGKKNKGAAVDPSVVQLSDGSLRLYYFGPEITQGDPARQEGKHNVYSAKSSDGINFVVEKGIRFEDFSLTDPEVITFGDKWLMYYSVGASTKLASSTDGLNFNVVNIIGGEVGGVPGALAVNEGIRLFGCSNGISTAISSDGVNFRQEQTDILNIRGMVCDPAAIKLANGRYAMIYKIGNAGPQQQPPQQQQQPPQFQQQQTQQLQQQKQQAPAPVERKTSVETTNSKYKVVSSKPTGWFSTQQAADIMLSGIDFNNAGGPLLLNHPGNAASDGTHLLLADRNNNRILVWNSLPTGNTPPDLVLGQKDFYANNPGTGLDKFNWPVKVAAANGKVVVADTYNDRILIWNTFPTRNGQTADIEIKDDRNNPKRNVGWPWAVWTDGEKLVVTSTAGAKVLIWNTFPTQNNQAADIVLTANEKFGTPRSIASDGKHLLIGDHNAKPNEGRAGNFFWKTFPAQDYQMYDFFASEPFRMGEGGPNKQNQNQGGDVLWSSMTEDGKLIGVSNLLYIWNKFPENEDDGADFKIGGVPGQTGYDFGGKQSGDGSTPAIVNGKLYISLSNGNKVVGFNSLPTRTDQAPDFVIGAPDIYTNTLMTNYFISNSVPASNGKNLFVISGFDGTLSVWKNIPDQSGAKPDFRYQLKYPPSSIALHGNTLILAEKMGNFHVWKKLPLNGELPDAELNRKIGNVNLDIVGGIALDDKYFYVAAPEKEGGGGTIYVWIGVPGKNSDPVFSFKVNSVPSVLSSDGKYLAVLATEPGSVTIFRVDQLSANAQGTTIEQVKTNLPQGVFVSEGSLFVGDTGFNRVKIWKNIEDAIAGRDADIVLGNTHEVGKGQDVKPEIGKNKLFWPSGVWFDGSYLWVGEFKFSNRVLRFSVK